MNKLTLSIVAIATTTILASCGSNPQNMGNSTPIDSTNVKGSAPATYGANDPARDQNTDSNRTNVHDTGTKANNIHNEGTTR